MKKKDKLIINLKYFKSTLYSKFTNDWLINQAG